MSKINIDQLENLVFSGGGVRGLAYVGMIMAFEDTFNIKVSDHFQCFSGSSVGALFALVCIMGLNVSACLEAFQKCGIENIFAKDPTWLLTNYALNSGQSLRSLVLSLLEMNSLNETSTFNDLHERTGKRLVIAVVDILSGSTIYLDHANEGRDMPLILGIMASMALPPLFPPVHYQNGTNLPLLMIDGGLLDNFPLALFPSNSTLGVRTAWYIDPGSPMSDISSYYTRILSILQVSMHSMLTTVQNEYPNSIFIDLGPVKADTSEVDIKEIVFLGYRTSIAKFNGSISNYEEMPMKYINNKRIKLPAYIENWKFSKNTNSN